MPAVLFTDADRELRDVYVWLLTSYGFQVETAGDGLECLARLRQFVPNVLILDFDMPWGGGDGVLGVIRDDARLIPTQVVLTSAVASADILEGLVSPPAVQALRKPFQLSALIETASLGAFMKRAYEEMTSTPKLVLHVKDEPTVASTERTDPRSSSHVVDAEYQAAKAR